MRARWVLAIWCALVAVAGATVAIDGSLGSGTSASDQVVGSSNGGTTRSTVPADPVEVLRPGQTRVTGTVTALHAEDAVLDPRELPVPLTIDADRGLGNGAEITNAMVGGSTATIVWDAGRPLALTGSDGNEDRDASGDDASGDGASGDGASGDGALVVDPVTIDVVPEGLRLRLAGAVHGLTPGTYRIDSPVAVGREGFASPRDSVTFTADEATNLETSGEPAVVLAPDQPRRFTGPGLLQIDGDLEVRTADGSATARRVDTSLAELDVTLTPTGDGTWIIDALLEGDVVTRQ